ncbi:hypothetical protein LEP1GSC048_3784 [Leptospira santarosai serovar Shermani str. 1342KT]|nr:hypothetical protein LEP1GSC048_3784 [Leptospira santarosai serovar Shermani str. 1342KT]
MGWFQKKIRPEQIVNIMKLIFFILITYLVYRFLSRFFTTPTERPNTQYWKTFYKNVSPTYHTPKEKDISSQARVIDSSSLGEK